MSFYRPLGSVYGGGAEGLRAKGGHYPPCTFEVWIRKGGREIPCFEVLWAKEKRGWMIPCDFEGWRGKNGHDIPLYALICCW